MPKTKKKYSNKQKSINFSVSFMLRVIHFLVISVFTLGILIVVYGWESTHSTIVDTIDQMKSSNRFTISFPLFLVLNILTIVFCLPLAPVQLFTGYCLGDVFGITVNCIGTIIGMVVTVIINSFTKIIHNILYKFHTEYCQNLDEGGFTYIFVTIYVGKLNIGSAIQLASKHNMAKTLSATITTGLIFSFFFGYIGSLIDPFILFIRDTKEYSVIIQLTVMFTVAITCYIGARYWYFSIDPSSKNETDGKNEDDSDDVDLPRYPSSCFGLLKYLFFNEIDEREEETHTDNAIEMNTNCSEIDTTTCESELDGIENDLKTRK